jgi:hypothetical protein
MLHVVGLGGQYVYATEIPTGSGTIVNYAHGFTTEYELVTSGISLSKISGNSALSVTSNEILNTATNLGSPTTPALINGLTRQAATGSIEIKGIGITTVTFKIYMRGDAGIIYNSSNNPTSATFGNILRWTNQVDFVPSGQPDKLSAFNGDKYLLALSLQPCQLISNPSADQSICTGTSGANITVNTDQNTANSIRFVKFSTDQMVGSTPTATEAATIYGGTPIATVTPTGASNPYTATYPWNNSDFPTVGTYYVYAILGSAIVGDCYPVQEIKVTINALPTLGTNTPSAGTCSAGGTPNDDATITFAGFTNADKAEKAEAATYTGVAYSAATGTVISGGITFSNLKHNTQYTFRFWNAADGCFVDVTLTTPTKTCVASCSITASATTTPPTCANNDGAINLTVTSGSSAQTYLWSNGATTQNLTAASAGDYTVTVTDGACKTTATASLSIVPANSIYDFCPGNTFELKIQDNTLTGIQWQKDGVNIPSATGLTYVANAVGVYTYTSNGIGGCAVGQCCPIEIKLGTNCCKINICLPVIVTKH